MYLKHIIDRVYPVTLHGHTDITVTSITFNSKDIVKDSLFVAIKGNSSDGHSYIDHAIHQGASSIVCESLPEYLHKDITYIKVENSKQALAIMAANYYKHPSKNIKLIGVTGTNGKTTVATLLYELFTKAGYNVGLLSTVKVMIGTLEFKSTHTTPDVLTINYHLLEMQKAGVSYCFMEVSSHGIHQCRVEGLHFMGGIFTNLSHDHLDYHDTFSEYRDVKKSFFDKLPNTAFALTNIDDKNGSFMLQNTKAKTYTYALKQPADYKCKILEHGFEGLLLDINSKQVWSQLIGHFNAYNILAVYATARLLEITSDEALQLVSTLTNVSGRFQYTVSKQGIIAIVDYAHTPDALKNILETVNDIRTKNENLITVMGCGGSRDKSKRPKMGHIASALSSKVIFTNDNPRDENPKDILRDIEEGVEPQYIKNVITIEDRMQAIKTACQMAQPKDIILIAGKGHENYQEIKGERLEFNDFKIVTSLLAQLDQ